MPLIQSFERDDKMIAVCPNPFRDIDLKVTEQAVKMLEDAGFETAVCPVFGNDDENAIPNGVKTHVLSEIADKCTLAVVIGGDGTILAVVSDAYKNSFPIVGVNLGTKGFMADLEVSDLHRIVDAARGECDYTERMMLDVVLRRNNEAVYTGTVLNDVVLRGYSDCIRLTAINGNSVITSFSGDGIILSTPTGSTGYSMSAGGPIVEPAAKATIISPICAHSMIARSFVLSANRKIRVETGSLRDRKAYIAVDGQIVADIEDYDVLEVSESSHTIKMVDFDSTGFFEIAYKKLV